MPSPYFWRHQWMILSASKKYLKCFILILKNMTLYISIKHISKKYPMSISNRYISDPGMVCDLKYPCFLARYMGPQLVTSFWRVTSMPTNSANHCCWISINTMTHIQECTHACMQHMHKYTHTTLRAFAPKWFPMKMVALPE